MKHKHCYILMFTIICVLVSSNIVLADSLKPYSELSQLEKNPLFGTRPWEEQLYSNEDDYKEVVSVNCEKKQKKVILLEKKRQEEIKRKKEEERRKREEAERRREEARVKELEEQKRWDYYENKDYKVKQSSSAKEKADALIEYAKDHLGARYVYGGSSWKGGVDCSGFTMLCYRKFGVSLPHYSEDQAHCGKAVKSLSAALPGDIICYYGHVGLYLGHNRMIHASSPSTGVIITHGVHYRKIKCIRRIFN